MISIIIPVYNEEEILSQNPLYFRSLSKKAELIFVDGGSFDRSREIASDYGRVVRTTKSRALQMNYGAGVAKGDTLLFLHADTVIDINTLDSIENKLKDNNFIGGCLTQQIDKDGFIYRFIETFGNIRARLSKVFYGDQGIFVKKVLFFKIGCFPEVAIMEEIIFSKKLRKLGKTVVLPDKILASPRRWEKKGIINSIFLYSLINTLFWLKVPLEKIKHLYSDLR